MLNIGRLAGLLLLGALAFAPPLFALQLTIHEDLTMRFVEGDEARNYDSTGNTYKLKAGSIVEIPDSAAATNFDGSINLEATLGSWMDAPFTVDSPLGDPGTFKLHDKGSDVSSKTNNYFPIKVVSPAPGSIVPPTGTGFGALFYFLESNKLGVTSATDAQALVALIDHANQEVKVVGTPESTCPNGGCDGQVGQEEPETLACQRVVVKGFPTKLLELMEQNYESFQANREWMDQKMMSPSGCMGSCNPTNEAETKNLTSACTRAQYCHDNCSSADTTSIKCNTKAGRATQSDCKDKCSGFQNMALDQRAKELTRMFMQAHDDLMAGDPATGRRMEKYGGSKAQAMLMVCINMHRENRWLDPMMANCASSAVGIGQVVKDTFYDTLGINTDGKQSRCADTKIGDLRDNCRGFVNDRARLAIFGHKYDEIALKDLYQYRTVNTELQVRSSYATFVNKMIDTGFKSVDKALLAYFDQDDQATVNAIANINRCRGAK